VKWVWKLKPRECCGHCREEEEREEEVKPKRKEKIKICVILEVRVMKPFFLFLLKKGNKKNLREQIKYVKNENLQTI
jgi:hypothetical protein